jgi:predicted nucleotidyltransferase
VATPERFVLPRECLRDLNRWLKAVRVKGAIIGGVATALLGTARATHDVDLLIVIEDDEWGDVVEPAKRFGFEFRERDGMEFARQSRVLLLQHRSSRVEVDVILGQLDFECDVIARSKKIKVEGILVPVATPEYLIILKAVPRRPNDFADIYGLLEQHPQFDLQRVRKISGDFAALLDCPEFAEDIEGVLSQFL